MYSFATLECVSKTRFRAHEAIPHCVTFPLYSKRHQQVVTVSRIPGWILARFLMCFMRFIQFFKIAPGGYFGVQGMPMDKVLVDLRSVWESKSGPQTAQASRTVTNLFKGPSGGPPDPSWCRPPVLWGAWGRFGIDLGTIWVPLWKHVGTCCWSGGAEYRP